MSAYGRPYGGWSNSRGREDGGDDFASHRRPAYNSGQSANRQWERSKAPNDKREADPPQKPETKQAPTAPPKEVNAREPPSRQYGDDDWRGSYKPKYGGGDDDRWASGQKNNNKDDVYARGRPDQRQQYVANEDDDEEETGEDFLDQLTLSPRGQHIVMKKPGEPSYSNTKIVIEDLQLFMDGNQIEDFQWANEKKTSSAQAKTNADAKPIEKKTEGSAQAKPNANAKPIEKKTKGSVQAQPNSNAKPRGKGK